MCSLPQEEGAVVIFNVTTLRPSEEDSSCIIKPGEHAFVSHDSVVAYARGKLFSPDAYETMVKLNVMQVMDPVTAELLNRIQRGALASRYTAKKFKDTIRTTLGL